MTDDVRRTRREALWGREPHLIGVPIDALEQAQAVLQTFEDEPPRQRAEIRFWNEDLGPQFCGRLYLEDGELMIRLPGKLGQSG